MEKRSMFCGCQSGILSSTQKNWYGRWSNQMLWRKTTFKITDDKNLAEKSLVKVTRKDWRKALLHSRKIKKNFCEVDFGEECPQQVDKVTILWYSDTSDTDDSFNCSCDQEFWCWSSRPKVICWKGDLWRLKYF